MGTSARFAADMGSHLAKGSMDVVKTKIADTGTALAKLQAEKLPQQLEPIWSNLNSPETNLPVPRIRQVNQKPTA